MARKAKQTVPKPSSTAPPVVPPFKPANDALLPFLKILQKSKIYISHVDVHPAFFKRRIFTVPILLNLAILLLLLYRIYFIYDFYIKVVLSALGHRNEVSVDTKSSSWGTLLGVIIKRALTLVFDFILIRIVWPWPLSFFIGPGEESSPVIWRWKLGGYRDKEIYVRGSRSWGSEDLLGTKAMRKGQESPFWKTRVLPAVDEDRLRTKTGYLLIDKDFDLEFWPMTEAHRLVDSGDIEESQLDGCVWAWIESKGWCVWRFKESPGPSQGQGSLEKLRDWAVQHRKEELFFWWLERVAEERNKAGGLTEEGRAQIIDQATNEWKARDAAFDEVIAAVGGESQLPGLEMEGNG